MNDVRPIDADALVNTMCFRCKDGDGEGACAELCRFANAVSKIPTLDYAPVRHGEWIPVWHDLFKLGYVKCSVCGHKEKKGGWAYCHCGAKMDGGEIMSKQAKPTRTCADCFHCQACHMWGNGAISDTVASKCQQFEPVSYASLKQLKDLYKMYKGETAPVRHARWEKDKDDLYWGNHFIHQRCSLCGGEAHINRFGTAYILSDFCPKCGAKMDGGAEDA